MNADALRAHNLAGARAGTAGAVEPVPMLRTRVLPLLLLPACFDPNDRERVGFVEAASVEDVCSCQAPFPAPPLAAPLSWIRGGDLLPAWGYYPASLPAGDTPNLSDVQPFNYGLDAHLTWVVQVPAGSREVFVRAARVGGAIPDVIVHVDDVRVGALLTPHGDGWYTLGGVSLSAGIHHVDIALGLGSALDAVMLAGAKFHTDEPLPLAVNDPGTGVREPATTRAARLHRRAAMAGPFVLGPAQRFDEDTTDWRPFKGKPALEVAAARRQTVATAMSLALAEVDGIERERLRIEPSSLRFKGFSIAPSRVDVRVALTRLDDAWLFDSRATRPVARLLVKDDAACPPAETGSGMCPAELGEGPIAPAGVQGGFQGGMAAETVLRAGEERQIWITVDVPDVPPGRYEGTIGFQSLVTSRAFDVPITVEVADITLPPAPGWNGVGQGACFGTAGCSDPPEAVIGYFEDQLRHGMNAIEVRGYFDMLEALPPSRVPPMHVLLAGEDGTYGPRLTAARDHGWDPLWFLCDEPPAGCSDMVSVHDNAVWAHEGAAPPRKVAVTFSSDAGAWSYLTPVIDHPIVSIGAYGDAAHAAELAALPPFPNPELIARRPLVYWSVADSYPALHRALAGLYPRAIGYDGFMPNRWDDAWPHALMWPDEALRPIPTRGWEAMREGLDDLRYFTAFAAVRDELHAAPPTPEISALAAEADALYTAEYASLAGYAGYHRYLTRLPLGGLDASRARFVSLILRARAALGT
jgi:hypothetical protein